MALLAEYFAKYNLNYLFNIKFSATFINLLANLANFGKILAIKS